MDKISIIIPCYNEEKALPLFWEALNGASTLIDNVSYEYIFVDDGSKDSTLEIIKGLAKENPTCKYISFSRNFGKEAAMYAGLEKSCGDYVVIMDADMQDPPELLPDMYKLVKEEGFDCAATRRVNRLGEPKIRSFFARTFYKLMKKITKIDIVDGARDYRLMTRQMVDSIVSLEEYNRFSKGIFSWVGFNTKWLEYENRKRVKGETKWSFGKLLVYSFEGIVAFSTVPLAISSIMGLVFCLLAFLAIIFVVVRQLIWQNSAFGWASMVSIILMLSGLQLFSIGILGQYLAKTYLEVKNRPIYIEKETNIIKEDRKC